MGIWAPIIAFILSAVIVIAIIYVFLHPALVLLFNAFIIYLALYRAYFDLRKKHRKPYIIGLLLSLLITLLLRPIWILWDITSLLAMNFVLVELMRWWDKRRRTRRQKK